eukprot:337194-Chlamydomonas_euryale.AAC.1
MNLCGAGCVEQESSVGGFAWASALSGSPWRSTRQCGWANLHGRRHLSVALKSALITRRCRQPWQTCCGASPGELGWEVYRMWCGWSMVWTTRGCGSSRMWTTRGGRAGMRLGWRAG